MIRNRITLICLTISFLILILIQIIRFDPEDLSQASKRISNEDNIYNVSIEEFRSILKPILIERVVGTASHEQVKTYISTEMERCNWTVELDTFKERAPNKGKLTFTNIITTLKPDSDRFLVFACHYDSKDMNFKFVAATDSAVPCAMLLYLARTLTVKFLNVNSDMGLKFIFFDGEEAFVSWSKTDSLYGARHLANQMEQTQFRGRTLLHSIDLFVLLDLIGAENPTFYNYFPKTTYWYNKLVEIEKKLADQRLLKYNLKNMRYFRRQDFFGAGISDDHEPFLERGVPVLHLIPHPFPSSWHTARDNEANLHYPTIKNLLTIFQVFIIRYLNGDLPV